MKRVISFVFLLSFTLVVFAENRVEKLIRELNNPKSKKVFVVAHRGDWRNAPENSLQAFQNCIDMGVDMIELDLHMSKDSVLFLMHDNTVDRTTNGRGKVSDLTSDELKKKYKETAWTEETVTNTKNFDDSGYILLKITENGAEITKDNPGYIRVRK